MLRTKDVRRGLRPCRTQLQRLPALRLPLWEITKEWKVVGAQVKGKCVVLMDVRNQGMAKESR